MSAVTFQPFPMTGGRRAQVWRHQPQFRRPRHFHEEPELNLVVKGQGVVGVGDRVLQVSAGELLFFHAGQDHVLIDASDDLDLFVMALRPELAARVSLGLAASRSCRLSSAELLTVTAQLAGLTGVHDDVATEHNLADLFATASARLSGAHVISRRALESVRAQPSVSGGALAQRLRTAPSGISRRFHRDLGVRFVEYRSRLRLMGFVRLVDQGRSLSHAALEADFGSYAQCHRVFQRILGCAPQEYFAGERARVNDAKFTPDLLP